MGRLVVVSCYVVWFLWKLSCPAEFFVFVILVISSPNFVAPAPSQHLLSYLTCSLIYASGDPLLSRV